VKVASKVAIKNAFATDYVSEDIIAPVRQVCLVPLAQDGQVGHPAPLQGLYNGAKDVASRKRGSRINNQLEHEGESQKPGL
jgi:hypothetical protein